MYFYVVLTCLLRSVVERAQSRDDRGATAVEYGLLVALIAAIIIVVVALLGTEIRTAFSSITDKL